jgi:glutathione-regulated potassium-efflux system ancillary protein KefG
MPVRRVSSRIASPAPSPVPPGLTCPRRVSEGVAELLGLAHRNTVSVYQHRHEDMPRPVLNLGNGRVKLWLRPGGERWAANQADRDTNQRITSHRVRLATLPRSRPHWLDETLSVHSGFSSDWPQDRRPRQYADERKRGNHSSAPESVG